MVERLKHYILVRHGHNWIQLFRFGLVGASGVVVNLLVAIMCKKIGPDANGIAFDLPFTDFNVRWYHVYSTIAFLVANLWNFQLNRLWTFRSAKHSGWLREYLPFLAVGMLGPDRRPRHPDPADAPGFDVLAVADVLRQLHRLPHPALLGPADHHRHRHADVVRAEQDLDVLRRSRQERSAGSDETDETEHPEHARRLTAGA